MLRAQRVPTHVDAGYSRRPLNTGSLRKHRELDMIMNVQWKMAQRSSYAMLALFPRCGLRCVVVRMSTDLLKGSHMTVPFVRIEARSLWYSSNATKLCLCYCS